MRRFPTMAIFRSALYMVLSLSVFACHFASSVEKDLATGLKTRGAGLSCDKVYLSDGENVLKRHTFIYGETIFVNFDGLEGFKRINEGAFPNMQLVIVSEKGDTVLYFNDMYNEYSNGIEKDPLDLYGEVTVADPIHSGEKYTLYIQVRDKMGTGSFRAILEFEVIPDEKIIITGNQVTSREIYLFSEQRGRAITDGKATFNENIYMLFEGLNGFQVADGKVYLGLSLEVKDATGNLILDEPDLLTAEGMSYDMLHEQLAPNFILSGSQIDNPISCRVRVWDKKGTAWINVFTELTVD